MNAPSTTPTTIMVPHVEGSVHGGQQPVIGASIQLYAVNATTDQGASTPMLTSGVTTDSSGNFSISGLYSCPVSNPFVYIVSTGGNPGVGGNNTDIVMMALLGRCSTLTSTTFINITELTTAAAAYFIAPFIGDAGHIGSSTTNLGSIAQGISEATSLINLGTGAFRASALIVQELQITTIANVLAACVNTTGGASGSATPCGNLLLWTGSGTFDTLMAAVHMAQSPTNNAAQLFGLITATPPFQPYFTSLPTDLAVTVGLPLPPNIRTGALDSTGQVWIYTAGYTYNTQTDTSTDLQGVLTVYDNNLNPLHTITPGTGGLYYPMSAAPDASGHVFFMNSNNTVSEFASNGTAISPAGGWSTGVTPTFTGTGTGNGYVNNSTPVDPFRVDAQGNIWGVTPIGASNCYVEMNSSGVVITPVGTFCGTNTLADVATDGSGNAWGNGSAAISKVNAAGALSATATNVASCFYPSSVASAANPTGYFYVDTNNLAYDHIHNQLWGYSYTGAGAITNGGTSLFCNAGSTALPVIPVFGPSVLAAPGSPYSGGGLLINSGTLDGAGNFWYITGGVSGTGVVGSTPGTFSGTAKFTSYLNGISPSGTLLTTYNAGANQFGMQPTGVGANATATASNATATPLVFSVGLLGVDVFGNIWMEDILSNRVVKVTGVATANTVNY